jgi:hypothetical protein
MVEFVPPIAPISCGLLLEWHFTQCAVTVTAHTCRCSESSSQLAGNSAFFCHVDFEPMDPDTQRQKRQHNVISWLNVTIEAMNLAKEVSSITPAKAVFASVSVILTMVRVGFFLRCLC